MGSHGEREKKVAVTRRHYRVEEEERGQIKTQGPLNLSRLAATANGMRAEKLAKKDGTDSVSDKECQGEESG